jgi:hypothetical protein
MPSWKKVIISGSDAALNSLTVTNIITGSLFGTASYATSASQALTASYSRNLQISGSINNVDYIDFNTGSAVPAYKSGRVFWDNTDGALSVYNAEADITLQVGQESWVRVFNEGTTITNGTAVRLVGSHGDVPLIVRAQSQQVSGSALGDNQIIGLATHTIETNSIGYVTTQGLVRGLNTNGFVDGDLLFVSSSAGVLTNVVPQSPFEVIQVGVCVKAGPGASGIIFVFPTQPIDFGDLASAERGTYQYGDIWSYQQTGSVGVWKHGRSLSGSYSITGSLNVTQGITGSLFGTASYSTSASVAINASSSLFATTATNATNIIVADDTSTNATFYPVFGSSTLTPQQVKIDSTGLTYNPNTNTLTTSIISATSVTATSGVSSTTLNVAGNGATADPYGTAAVTEPANASNYSYYGLTRAGSIGTGFGITGTNGALNLGQNSFWFGTATSGFAGTMNDAWLAFNASSFRTAGLVSASLFNGAGTGLTGTATSLSIGGNASTATTATNVVGGTNRVLFNNGTNTTTTDSNLTWNGATFNIGGTLTATVKSFIIDHPTKEGKKLQYGVLEGPEHSVYVRGKLTNNNTITLPDHWHALVHEDTITVNLTPIGKRQDLWVETVTDTSITVGSDNEINCFYTVFAERKDIEKLVTEFDK